ncbi:MAG: hypothetical protein AAB599_01335 [Patescibacteria group bacterium]
MSFEVVPAVISGFTAFRYLTHRESDFWHKIPEIKLHKRIQVSPSVRVFTRTRVIHFHHWFNCLVLLCVSIYSSGGFIDAAFTKGVLIGGILQGLSMPEARKLVYSQRDSAKNFSREKIKKI